MDASKIKMEKILAEGHAQHLITYSSVFRDAVADLSTTEPDVLLSFACKLLACVDITDGDTGSSEMECEEEFRPLTPVRHTRGSSSSPLERLDDYMSQDSVLGKYF